MTFPARLRGFWTRVSDGMALGELWSQLVSETRAGYRQYSQDVATRSFEGETRPHRAMSVARSYFWAILLKLSPARRVILLVALVLTLFRLEVNVGRARTGSGSLYIYGVLLLLLLLLLEVADRVTMKRDLEIAREIQLWLVPPIRLRSPDWKSPG